VALAEKPLPELLEARIVMVVGDRVPALHPHEPDFPVVVFL
jgi:hypothetical protein